MEERPMCSRRVVKTSLFVQSKASYCDMVSLTVSATGLGYEKWQIIVINDPR